MQFGDYPTPGDVKIYIGTSYVDDAYRIDYNEQNSKVPLSGYHQKHHVQVADGKVLVVGNIIIHFRFPGYLTYAIKNVLNAAEEGQISNAQAGFGSMAPGLPAGATTTPSDPTTANRSAAYKIGTRDTVLQAIESIRRSTVDQRVQSLVASHELGLFEQQSTLLNTLFGQFLVVGSTKGDPKFDPLQSPVEMAPDSFMGGTTGLDLRLYYGYIGGANQGVYVTEVLRGVHFTGKRKVVNASTSGGDLSASGQSILEVYPFFARSVDSLVSDKPPDFLGVN